MGSSDAADERGRVRHTLAEIRDGLKRTQAEASNLAELTFARTFPGRRNEIINNQESWEPHLLNSDPRFRFAALQFYSQTPPDNPRISDKISDIVRNDPVELVRCSAVMALLSVFQIASDRNILRLLAQLALDGAESGKVRKAAYWGLLGVCGKKGDTKIGYGRKALYEEYQVDDFDLDYLAAILG